MADSIAYGNHDLDDGLKSGIVSFSDIGDVDLWKEALDRVEATGVEMDERMKARQVVRTVINMEVTDLIGNSSRLIARRGADSPEKVQMMDEYLVAFSDAFLKKKTARQEFLNEKFYQNYRVIRMQRKAARFITEIFDAYVKHPEQLPPEFQDWADREGIERTVADYIAGMTDRFALDEYKRLFHPWERV